MSVLLFVGAAFVLLFFLVPLWFLPVHRSVTVSANTAQATFVFSSPTSWLVRGAVLCDPFLTCDPKQTRYPRESISFEPCDRIQLVQVPALSGVLVMLPQGFFGPGDLSDHDTLYLSDEDFAAAGSQPSIGYLEIGGIAGTGSRILQSGTFAFLERDIFSRIWRRSPDIVRDGDLRHGDQVVITAREGHRVIARGQGNLACEAAPDWDDFGLVPDDGDGAGLSRWVRKFASAHVVQGHVAASPDFDARGFNVTASAATSDLALKLTRIGLPEPIIVRPNWLDVVIASPAFLAISALLGLFAQVLDLFDRKRDDTKSGD